MSATAQLALDVRGFLAGVDMAKQGLNSLRSESVKLDEGSGMARLQMAAIALAAGVTALGIAMYKGVVSTVELGARLVEVSYKSGLAVEEIMALERSLDEVGGKAQDAAPATDKFNAAIQQAANNAGPLAGILNDAGISMQQLAGMSVAERMTAVGDAIRAIKNPAQQSEAAMATFGASGIKMLAALDPKNLNSASSAMGAQAQIMQANAGVFSRIMQLMGAQGSSLNSLAVAVKGKLQGLFTGIAAGVAPTVLKIMEASAAGGTSLANSIRAFSPALEPLASLVQKLVSLDLAGFGQQLGLGAAAIMTAIKSGDALSYIKNGLQIAAVKFRTLLNQAADGASAAFAELGNKVDFEAIRAPLDKIMAGAGNLLLGAVRTGLAAAIEEAQAIRRELIEASNQFSTFDVDLKFFADGIAGIADIFVGTIKSGIASALASIREGLGAFGAAIPKSIAVSLEKSGQEDLTKGKNALLTSAKNAADAVSAAVDSIVLGFDPTRLRETGKGEISQGKEQVQSGATELKDSAEMVGLQIASNFERAGSAFLDASTKAGEASKPELAMLADAQKFIADRSLQQARTNQAEMQQKFATPAAGKQDITMKAAAAAQPGTGIFSSMAKIGGDVRGPQTSALDLARQQLQAQQKTAESTTKMAEQLTKLTPVQSTQTVATYS